MRKDSTSQSFSKPQQLCFSFRLVGGLKRSGNQSISSTILDLDASSNAQRSKRDAGASSTSGKEPAKQSPISSSLDTNLSAAVPSSSKAPDQVTSRMENK